MSDFDSKLRNLEKLMQELNLNDLQMIWENKSRIMAVEKDVSYIRTSVAELRVDFSSFKEEVKVGLKEIVDIVNNEKLANTRKHAEDKGGIEFKKIGIDVIKQLITFVIAGILATVYLNNK